MPEIYRAFLYVLIVSLPALWIARKALRPTVGDKEIGVWIKAWLFTTAAVFLSGGLLVFSLLIAALAIYVHRASEAPYRLFAVLLLTAPALGANVAIPGLIASLIELTPGRLLALAFLVPTAIRLRRSPQPKPALALADKLMVALALLLVVLSARYGSPTYLLRAVAVIALDIALPYYVFSRAVGSLPEVRATLSAFVFAALPFAVAGALEFVRGWRLYSSVASDWNLILVQAYLFRDGMLRAAITAIEPIAFGFVCMVALGFLFALRSKMPGRLASWGAFGLAALGLAVSLSRGPWLGAVALTVIFAALMRPNPAQIVKAASLIALLAVPLMFTPAGERVFRLLPFVGSVDNANEDYRSQLIDISITIVSRNPFFGDAFYRQAPELAQMVQGQGIVDIVNTYVALALEYGLVGLALFLAVFFSIGVGLVRAGRRATGPDAALFCALAATLAAIGLTIATVSSVSVIPYIYWAVAGVGVAALRFQDARQEAAPEVTAAPAFDVLGRVPLFEPPSVRRA